MKELSIEEKAKVYDEVIDKIADAVEAGTIEQGFAKWLFPELKESEDERIRKALMQNLKERFGTKGKMGEGLDMPHVLAWFERQGEQKLNVNDNAKEMFIKALERVEEQNAKGYELTDCDKNSWWEDFKNYTSCTIEQKPAEEYNITGIGSKNAQGKLGEMIKKLKPVNEVLEQKQDVSMQINPSEYINDMGGNGCYLKNTAQESAWTEEDELHIRELESLVKQVWATAEHENDKDTIHKMSDLSFFLKTLKPQLKQDWDEEDENNILFLTSIIEECFKNKEKITLCSDTVCANFTKEDVIDRLKSLKGRVKPQSTWKPSDEQMTQLKRYCPDNRPLTSLYEQLKKLKP